MKPDKLKLAAILLKTPPYTPPKISLLKSSSISRNRLESILHKWYDNGWYDYGLNIQCGWLTNDGRHILDCIVAMENPDLLVNKGVKELTQAEGNRFMSKTKGET
jgi:hypothetical protein